MCSYLHFAIFYDCSALFDHYFLFNCVFLFFPLNNRLFHWLDLDKDEHISAQELTALIIGIEFENIDLDNDDVVSKVMEDFDTSGDAKIDSGEFLKGITKWLEEAKHSVVDGGSYSKKFVDDFHRVSFFVVCFLEVQNIL